MYLWRQICSITTVDFPCKLSIFEGMVAKSLLATRANMMAFEGHMPIPTGRIEHIVGYHIGAFLELGCHGVWERESFGWEYEEKRSDCEGEWEKSRVFVQRGKLES